MKIRDILKKIFNFGKTNRQFSLGDRSWKRPKIKPKESEETLSKDLATNRSRLEEIFVIPPNQDIVLRPFQIPALNKEALVIYVDGLIDRVTLSFAALEPLMVLNTEVITTKDPIRIIYERLLPGHQITKTNKMTDVINGILDGSSVLIIDGSDECLVLDSKGWEHRPIEKPANEHVVRGPQEGFTETFRVNTASVRRYIKDPGLVTEIFRVGKRSRTLVGVMYIKDICDPQLVEEVKYRIQSISDKTDYISETGSLEEYIEDHPRALVPQMLSTERPDRIAAHIREGFVGVIMANSPYSLAIPTTFSIFLHAAEDQYLRWPFGNFLRILRASSIFIALLLPAIYIATVNYHQEMIPTDLLLAITSSRESVPFPSIIEILFMEFSFELIREAGTRIPSVIGPTIGIVGALILGQAAVAASIVSPILIIVVAITALGSFVVPTYNASFTIRLVRFLFTLLGGFMGFFGIAFGVFMMTLHVATVTSFGVPFLSPITPFGSKNNERIIRPLSFDQPYRPLYLHPLDWIRQSKVVRPWDNPREDSDQEGSKS